MNRAQLVLTRRQVLAFRRRVGSLDRRMARGRRSLRRAAPVGLQDSMPRAALLSLHARVEGVTPDSWEDPALVQLWGPRYSAYAVAAEDRALFTLGRLPDDEAGRARATETADRLQDLLGDRRMPFGQAGRALGVGHNSLRYAAPTGRVIMRWDGARQPEIWMVAAPDMDPHVARRELARRYVHVFGPTTPESFSRWAGVRPGHGAAAFESLSRSLAAARSPIGEGWILHRDEEALRAEAEPAAPARLLPSGDAYWLLQGDDRSLLVTDPGRRDLLWTSRVWPGAVLVAGEIVGVWRRAGADVTIQPWRRLSRPVREAVAFEAESLPLPGLEGPISVHWEE